MIAVDWYLGVKSKLYKFAHFTCIFKFQIKFEKFTPKLISLTTTDILLLLREDSIFYTIMKTVTPGCLRESQATLSITAETTTTKSRELRVRFPIAIKGWRRMEAQPPTDFLRADEGAQAESCPQRPPSPPLSTLIPSPTFH